MKIIMKMKMKNLLLLAFVAISMTFVSCGDDDVDCSDETALEAAIEDETTDLLTTGTAYAQDPTNSDLCNAYADAINAYVDAISPYRECVSSEEKEDFDASLAIIQSAADDLDC